MSKYIVSVGRTAGGDKLDFTYTDLGAVLDFVTIALENDYAVVIVKHGVAECAPAQKKPVQDEKPADSSKAFIKKKKPVDPAQIEELYLAGMDPADIAKELGCQMRTVMKTVNSLNAAVDGANDKGDDIPEE